METSEAMKSTVDRMVAETLVKTNMVADPVTGEIKPWKRQEIAYRIPNPKKGYAMGEWKRCIPKTLAAFDRKILALQEKDAEINTRDAD